MSNNKQVEVSDNCVGVVISSGKFAAVLSFQRGAANVQPKLSFWLSRCNEMRMLDAIEANPTLSPNQRRRDAESVANLMAGHGDSPERSRQGSWEVTPELPTKTLVWQFPKGSDDKPVSLGIFSSRLSDEEVAKGHWQAPKVTCSAEGISFTLLLSEDGKLQPVEFRIPTAKLERLYGMAAAKRGKPARVSEFGIHTLSDDEI